MGPWTDEQLPPGYPVEWEADVVLRDGTVAHVRPIRPTDADGIRRFHAGAVRRVDLPALLRAAAPAERRATCTASPTSTTSTGSPSSRRCASEIIGIGRYDRIDAAQRRGRLQHQRPLPGQGHRLGAARAPGRHRPGARRSPVHRRGAAAEPQDALGLHRRRLRGHAALRGRRRRGGVRHRAHRAVARPCGCRASTAPRRSSMRALLHPASIAVIGASRRARRRSAASCSTDILDGGFTGPVHAVNPDVRTRGAGLHAPTRRSPTMPGPVDLAVVAVPAHAVLERRRRVRRGRGQGAARRVVRVRRGGPRTGISAAGASCCAGPAAPGMRVVGPELVRADQQRPRRAAQRLARPDAARRTAGSGCSPSRGALGIAVLASAARRGLGISTFASAGNRVDVSGNDFMQYWIDDDATDAVGLYLESMGNPRKFSRIARNLALIKPVIVVKSGVSAFGVPPGHRVRADQGAARGVLGDAAAGRRHPGRERPPALRRRPARRAPAAARRATGSPSSATPTPSAR